MTIDEAIEKYKRITGEYTFVHDIDGCLEVVQLVEWLRTARGSESAARWYSDKLREAHRTERKLLNENAKLRKLVSVMLYCNQFRRDCDGCSLNGAAGIITERAGCDELLIRLRELGIEVPEQ